MLKNYSLIIYRYDGREIERNDGSGCTRYEFYSFSAAIRAMGIAINISERIRCVKLFRRRRAGGYRCIATWFRGGALEIMGRIKREV